MGYDVATPNLDRLASEGAVFTQAVSAAPITLPSHSSILTGLNPPSHGVRHNGMFQLSGEVETVAETLKQAGFATAAFVGAFVLDRRFGLDQGFDRYDDDLPEKNPVHPIYYAERRAEEVVARAVDWVKSHEGEPFFVWVHLYDPHAPHNAPSPFAERYPGRDYDAEVAYTDSALGPLLEAASGEGTAVVVTADHGEGLGEHGESTHTLFVYDSTMRIPLLVKAPGVAAGLRVERQVRSVDIAPTILELAGLPTRGKLDGVSLLPQLGAGSEPELPAYGETFGTLYQFNWSELRFLRKDGFKLIGAPRPELYDLEADPEELKNLWTDPPPDVGRRLSEELTQLSSLDEPASTLQVDEETRRRLESLGYATSIPSARPQGRPDPKDRVEVFERMQDLLGPNLSPQAQIDGYREILALEPENALARSRLANELARQGKLEEAVEEFRELLRVGEIDTNSWENLASALLLLNRTEEALALTERAVAEAPWYRELQVLRGEALEKAGRLEEALQSYQTAIDLRPELAENYWRHGVVALQLDDHDRAERDFRESLARDGSFEEGRLSLARLLSQSGRAAEAFEVLEAAKSDTADAKAALAEAHIASESYEAARALLEEARELEPENTLVLALLGPLYGRAGELPRAAATLEKAMALGETSPEIRRNLALVYLRQGKFEAAIAMLNRAIEDAPTDPSLWFSLGNASLRAQRSTRAAEAFERALALKPDWLEATFNLALAYERSGEKAKAVEAYRRFLASSDDEAKRAEAEKRLASLNRS
jgi:arylsulfatase A-like enzyme/tetratricopeptide (TPR) repeat protein